MSRLRNQLVKKLQEIPDLEDRPSKIAGGTAIFFKEKEIAHFHHDNEIDVRLTAKVIRKLKLEHPKDSKLHRGRAKTSQWMELRFYNSTEVEQIVELFKLALENY